MFRKNVGHACGGHHRRVFCVPGVAEEVTSRIFGIIIVLIVFGILMVCPRGPYMRRPIRKYVFSPCVFFLRPERVSYTHTHHTRFITVQRITYHFRSTMFSCGSVDILLLWTFGRVAPRGIMVFRPRPSANFKKASYFKCVYSTSASYQEPKSEEELRFPASHSAQ